MKNVLWQTGQRVIKAVLEWLQTAKESTDAERRQDYTDHGILKNELNEFAISVGDNNTPLTPSVNVSTGIAYDINGERIIVDDDSVEYDATNPSDTTDDGKGNLVPTPHSTESKNIPLTTNSENFIWIDYLQTTDESVFTLQKITNGKQFYKKTDGYQITVTTVDTAPTASSLKLGNVDLTGGGVVSSSTISESGRIYSRTKLQRVKIKTIQSNKSDRTTSYGFNTEFFLDDHIKAVGSGTPSATNPHGLSSEDIGLPPAGTVEEHQEFFHTSGIIGDDTTTTSGLFPQINAVNPGLDQLIIKGLTPSERVHVDGLVAVPDDFPSDHIEIFNSLDTNGTWYVYFDKNTFTVERTQTDLVTNPDESKFLICQVDWTFPGSTQGDLTNLIDLRVFGTISNKDLIQPLELNSGSASEPTYNFEDDPDTGLYLFSVGDARITINGTDTFKVDGDGIHSLDQLFLADGTVGTPSLTFDSDPDTGIYNPSVDELAFSTDGTERLSIDTSSIDFKLDLFKNGVAGIESVDIRDDNVLFSKLSNAVKLLWKYRRPVLQYVDHETIDVENNTQTSNETLIIFPDGDARSVIEDTSSTNQYRRFIITSTAEFTSGTEDSGLRSTVSETDNTWYAIYAVKSQIDSGKFVLVGDDTPPLPSNYSTLNSRYGTDGWVYLGLIRNGNNYPADVFSTNGDILNFTQVGNRTKFTANESTTIGGTFILGIYMSYGAPSFVFPSARGMGNIQTPDNISFLQTIAGIQVGSAVASSEKYGFLANKATTSTDPSEDYYSIDKSNVSVNDQFVYTIEFNFEEGVQAQAPPASDPLFYYTTIGFTDSALTPSSNIF